MNQQWVNRITTMGITTQHTPVKWTINTSSTHLHLQNAMPPTMQRNGSNVESNNNKEQEQQQQCNNNNVKCQMGNTVECSQINTTTNVDNTVVTAQILEQCTVLKSATTTEWMNNKGQQWTNEHRTTTEGNRWKCVIRECGNRKGTTPSEM